MSWIHFKMKQQYVENLTGRLKNVPIARYIIIYNVLVQKQYCFYYVPQIEWVDQLMLHFSVLSEKTALYFNSMLTTSVKNCEEKEAFGYLSGDLFYKDCGQYLVCILPNLYNYIIGCLTLTGIHWYRTKKTLCFQSMVKVWSHLIRWKECILLINKFNVVNSALYMGRAAVVVVLALKHLLIVVMEISWSQIILPLHSMVHQVKTTTQIKS